MHLLFSYHMYFYFYFFFFFFNDTATTEIYTLSLHDALPICTLVAVSGIAVALLLAVMADRVVRGALAYKRSEEHTSELQSQSNLVCRLLLEKKKNKRAERLAGAGLQH